MKALDGRRLYHWFVHSAVVILAVGMVILTIENNELRNLQHPVNRLQQGDVFSLADLYPIHEQATVDTTAKALIFIFSTSCSYCNTTRPYWDTLATIATKRGLSVFGILLDEVRTRDDLIEAGWGVRYPIVTPGDPKLFRMRNRILSVPHTIIRDEKGALSYHAASGLDREKFKEIGAAMRRFLW